MPELADDDVHRAPDLAGGDFRSSNCGAFSDFRSFVCVFACLSVFRWFFFRRLFGAGAHTIIIFMDQLDVERRDTDLWDFV